MRRLTLLALVAAASSLPAESPPEYPLPPLPRCPVYDPSVFPPPTFDLRLEDPWICVLPPPEDFTPWDIGPDGETVYYPIDPSFDVWPPMDGEGWTDYVMDYSDDFDVQLMETEFLGSKLVRVSTGETEQLPMVAASELAEPGAIVPAVMVELYGNALSGDGNVVVGNTHWGNRPFRYRAWGTGGLEFLQVPAETWASARPVELSRDGDIVVGSAIHATMGNEQAVRWNKAGELIALNPAHTADTGSCARLITPDGHAIAGDVYSLTGSGIVPFLWNETAGYQQLGDPNASGEQVMVQSLSDDGLMLAGARYDVEGNYSAWYWTAEEGLKNIEVAICGFEGEVEEGYTLTGIDPVRRVYTGTFADGEQFLNFDGVSISPVAWMRSIAGPVSTLRAAMGISSQTMEGAHHRPIKSLAIPGRNEFAWVTGDLGKATRQRDAKQSAGEFGYGMRIGADAVLGVAFGYSDLNQDYDATGSGETNGMLVVADLGFTAGPGDLTLTALFSRSDISTLRDGNIGNTTGNAYSLRARYDKGVGRLGSVPVTAFASLTYDHSNINGYAETPTGIAPAAYGDQSKDSWVGRLGVTGKLALGQSTDLSLTLEAAHLLGSNEDAFTGTDIATGVLDFSVPDTRTKRTWGRLGLDIDHRLSADTVISLTLHASSEGDAFDTAAALSVRKGF